MRSLSSAIFIFLIFIQVQAAPEVYEKPQGYSSSYLPYSRGYLTRDGEGRNLEFFEDSSINSLFETLADAQVLSKFRSQSTLDRFDVLRASQLGETVDLQSRLTQFQPRPGAESWTGMCNQWCESCQHPEVTQLLSQTQGLFCNGTVLSYGEIKELFTGLYDHNGNSSWSGNGPLFRQKIIGNRNEADDTKKYENDYFRAAGVDDLSPEAFEETLVDQLSSNGSVTIERSHDYEVWNHPVFRFEVDREALKEDEVGSVAAKVPPEYFKARKKQAYLLESLTLVRDHYETVMVEVSGNSESPEAIAKVRAQLKAISDAYPGTPLESWVGRPDFSVSQVYSALTQELGNQIKSGEVKLKRGYSIEKVSSKVDYGNEVSFGALGAKSARGHYEYFLIKKKKKTVDSAWETPPGFRPDFLWTAESPSLDKIENSPASKSNPALEGLIDLRDLIRGCDEGKEILGLLRRISDTRADNRFTADEKTEVLDLFEKLSPDAKSILSKENLDRLLAET